MLETLRSRGAAAAAAFLLSAGGERRCVCARLNIISFGARGRVFVCAAQPLSARTIELFRTVEIVGPRSGVPALSCVISGAPLVQWQAIKGSSFGSCGPLCSAEVASVESVAGESSQRWGGSVAGTHNTQLQRTVILQHVRACGAHDVSARGR
jgi:hypothetical protein